MRNYLLRITTTFVAVIFLVVGWGDRRLLFLIGNWNVYCYGFFIAGRGNFCCCGIFSCGSGGPATLVLNCRSGDMLLRIFLLPVATTFVVVVFLIMGRGDRRLLLITAGRGYIIADFLLRVAVTFVAVVLLNMGQGDR